MPILPDPVQISRDRVNDPELPRGRYVVVDLEPMQDWFDALADKFYRGPTEIFVHILNCDDLERLGWNRAGYPSTGKIETRSDGMVRWVVGR